MSAPIIDRLNHICRIFAGRPGQIALAVQSKIDPEISVSVNSQLSIPSASVVKAAIACAAADHLDLTETRSVRDLEETFYCSILQAFDPSDRISLKALIGLMIIVSDNPATTAILDAVGLDKVNAWLSEKGLNDTNLAVGFSDDTLGAPLRANRTTARDCLRLMRLIDTVPDYGFVKHMLANNLRNERIPKRLPDAASIAHKTGSLNGLCHDIAIIESPDAAYYLVVLADELPEDEDFQPEIARLSAEIYDLMSG
jgi:beta-lactamase class A